MGDRGNIVLKFKDDKTIYLYSHWDGYMLPNLLFRALRRGASRWNDPTYLARIIATDVFNLAGATSTTGAGLSPTPTDGYTGMIVHLEDQEVEYPGVRLEYETYVQIWEEDSGATERLVLTALGYEFDDDKY